ncbi:MAG: hypothetical protein BGP06_19540 [Rhizobiales bacterium 65-9]|nr:MAG: hypothetical protein BGP06_19540 [Rhizobiales bacterium 65-9]
MLISVKLFEILRSVAHWRDLTNGAVDERLGEMEHTWRHAVQHRGEGIDAEALQRTIAAARNAELCGVDRRVRRKLSVRATMDGFAKGVIIDAAHHAMPSFQWLIANRHGACDYVVGGHSVSHLLDLRSEQPVDVVAARSWLASRVLARHSSAAD